MSKLLILQNIRSLIKNFYQLEAYLINTDKPNILALTERWLSTHSTKNFLQLDSYQQIVTASRKKRGGGVAFYVKEGISWKKHHEIITENTQMLTISVQANLLVTVVYKSPQSPFESFLNQLTEYLLDLDHSKLKRHIFCGDLNIDMLKRQ